MCERVTYVFKEVADFVYTTSHAVSDSLCTMAKKIGEIFKEIIYFPCRLYNGAKFALGRFACSLVLPAMKEFTRDAVQPVHDRLSHYAPNAREVNLQTPDGVTLNGVEIAKDSEQKWIVYFCPNLACWEQFVAHPTLLPTDAGVNFLCYNYRGVGYSTGRASSDSELVDDACLIVQSLLDKGVKPENILLHGLSLGGCIATLASCKLTDEKKNVALCNERSLSSAKNMLGGFIGFLASWANWSLDTLSRPQSLPERIYCMVHPQDQVIPERASFVKGIEDVKDSLKAQPTIRRMNAPSTENWHGCPWSQEDRAEYNAWVRKVLCISTTGS